MADDNIKKIMEKIEKLLAITEESGATEEEAIAAALAAQRLLVKYNLTRRMRTKGRASTRKGATHATSARTTYDSGIIDSVFSRKQHGWQTALASTVAKNFQCKMYMDHKYDAYLRKSVTVFTFYGHKQDAAAAKVVYDRLAAAAKKLGSSYARKRRKELEAQLGRKVSQAAIFNTWVEGFIGGVRSELERQSQELMIVTPRDVEIAYQRLSRNFRSVRERDRSRIGDAEARDAGRRAGRDSVRSGRVSEGNAPGLVRCGS